MIDIKLIEPQSIRLKDIELNKGQIPDVPQNPKFVRDEKYKLMVRSLKEHPELMGFNELWVYPYNGKYITISGNTRLRGLRELKWEEAPCKVIPAGTSAEDLRQYIFLANAIYGENDTDIIFNEFDPEDYELAGFEFNFEIDEEGEDAQAQEDDFDESKDMIPERAKKGDIFQLGQHRLMCGDSTKTEDMTLLMNGELADLWLTDPPYNVNYEGKTKRHLTIQNDSLSDSSFREFLVHSYNTAFENLKEGASFYIWHVESEGYNFRGALYDIGQKCRQALIWVKNSMVLGRQDFQWRHEPCLYGWKDGASHHWYSDRKQTTILEFDKPIHNREHPTMKPVPLFAYQIGCSTKKQDIVLDSFGGSGTTIIACEELGRKARVMEFTPHYCDVIIARWEKLTGKEAVKL